VSPLRRAGFTHAVVSLPALDLRRRPDHASEMRSQLLMGEVVRRLAASGNGAWWRVENLSDGYRGWARTWGLVPCTGSRAKRWLARARAQVVEPIVAARAERNGRLGAGPLFWNARVIAGSRRGALRSVEFPDGRRAWVAATALGPVGKPHRRLIERVRELQGVPYLWGGRTPAGFDCSGFVQQLLFEQGIQVPRDAQLQYRASRSVPRAAPEREGQLLFFGLPRRPVAHVALVLGGGYFVHARGWVRINSVESANPLYDRALMAQFRGRRAIR